MALPPKAADSREAGYIYANCFAANARLQNRGGPYIFCPAVLHCFAEDFHFHRLYMDASSLPRTYCVVEQIQAAVLYSACAGRCPLALMESADSILIFATDHDVRKTMQV
jgi:hypothetical protein